MRRPIIFAIAAVLSVALAATAAASVLMAEPETMPNVVSVSDYDLSSGYDADLLLDRIQGAARAVCGVDFEPHPLAERQAAAACVEDAMSHAVAQLDAPTLTARYAARQNVMLAGTVASH